MSMACDRNFLAIPRPCHYSPQLWKTARIAREARPGEPLRFTSLLASEEAFTAAGVELSAGVGAWLFFLTSFPFLFLKAVEGAVLAGVLWTYVIASFWFLAGGVFLAYRHGWMLV